MLKIRFKINPVFILTLGMYIGMGDCFGLIAWSKVFTHGELYDIFFVGIMLLALYAYAINRHAPLHKSDLRMLAPFLVLITYAGIEMLFIWARGTQGLSSSLMVIRDFLYILVFIPYLTLSYDRKLLIKILMLLDCVGMAVYAVECFTGPLTSLHVSGRYTNNLYRAYGGGAVFASCFCPLIIMAMYEGVYFFGKVRDKLIMAAYMVYILLRQGRTSIFAFLVACFLAYLLRKGANVRRILRRIASGAALVLMAYGAICVAWPAMAARLQNGISGVLNMFDSSYASTLAVRTRTLQYRYAYLRNKGAVLFGLGPLHNNYKITLDISSANSGIISSDTGYGTLLIRYGIFGIFLYVFSVLHVAAVSLQKKCNIYQKGVGIYMFVRLLNGISSHGSICWDAALKYGILMGVMYSMEKTVRALPQKDTTE